MGLDMYAYSVSKEVADKAPDIDAPLAQIAADHLGLEYPSFDGYSSLTEEQKEQLHRKQDLVEQAVSEFVDRDFFYWRKFNALHGWMQDLYNQRGGEGDFNMNPLRLYEEDLDRLLNDVKADKLTPRSGFFFGSQEIYPEDIESVEKFVKMAKTEIGCGRAIFYNSWW